MTKGRLGEGGTALAAWTSLTDRLVIEALARSNFDALVLDMQHGLHDTRSVHEGIAAGAALGKPVIVRVPVGDYAFVSRALDFGASGIILPMIETVEDARAFVAVAKYPPRGQRSFGPARAAQVLGFASAKSYMEAADGQTLALGMIETRTAFEALEDILSVDGLDGILVGPADLSLALFGGLDPDGAQTIDATATIARQARAAGKFCAIFAGSPQAAQRAREQGFDLACLSIDAGFLTAAASALESECRG